jgi:hypothetical protein
MGFGVVRVGHNLRCRALRHGARARLPVSVLLPQADPGWQQAARVRHRIEFATFAQSRGLSYEQYLASLARWLRQEVAASEVRVRMYVPRFEAFLAAGDYLTQYSVPFSGGAMHRGIRMMLEHTALGVPPACAPADRPIYGYLSGSDEAGQIQQYGEVVLRLRTYVRRRATFVMGDSLDHALHQFTEPAFVPQPVVDPQPLALMPYDVLDASSLGDACPPHRYAEAQIYGGLRPSDVSQAVYTLGTAPTPSAVAWLDRLRVQWTTTTDSGP